MQLKFISLNLWQGGNLFDAILEFLIKENPDILVMQEVYDGKDPALERKYRSFDILQEQLKYPATAFAPAFLDNRKEGKIPQGNAIFSKFPIVNTNVTFFNEPYREDYTEIPENFPVCPRNLQHAELDTPAGAVNVFNLQGVWDLDGDNYSVQRKRMSDVIIAETTGKSNVLLAGDTNAKPTNKAMRDIEQHLKSVFGTELATSFNMRRKTNPGYATAVVDLMYVSPEVAIVTKDCPDIDISDHRPLVVTLKILPRHLR